MILPGLSHNLSHPLIRFYRRHTGLVRGLSMIGFYTIWIAVFRLLVLTFITYLLMSDSHFQDISETFGSHEITIIGFAALAFVILLTWLNPLTRTTARDIFTPERLEKQFLPGFLHGSVLAAGVILAFLLSGIYRYLGFFIRFDEAPVALANVAIRVLALGALAYSEEFIFRHKALLAVRRQADDERKQTQYALDLGAVAITGLFYCFIKFRQFDLGIMHMITMFLISLSVGTKSLLEKDFGRGAGFLAAILIVFHPLLSLPVLGSDFSGVVLVKYVGGPEGLDTSSATVRFLSGGAGGPLGSFAFQLVLIADILRGVLRYKKMLFHSKRSH